MRLVRFTEHGWTRLGILLGDRVVDSTVVGSPVTLAEWMEAPPETWQQVAEVITQPTTSTYALHQVRLAAPLTHPSKIIAIGLNYRDHCREQGIAPPTAPLVFSKFPSTLIGPGETISWDPALTQQVDPEVELGVIIGTQCRAVTARDALKYVFGYTVVNDVSARDLQFGDGQWIRGKNLDTFCPLGPAIVTKEEVPEPQALRLRLWLNDRLQQEGTTADMIFSVAEIIAHVSQFATLEPGDLILTGTPWGVGCFRQPPVYLASGDVVRCAIEGIGDLINPTRTLANAREEQ